MTISLTYAELKALKPPARFLKAKAANFGPAKDETASVTFQQLKDGGATFGELIWLASAMAEDNPDCKRRLRLWAADCAARVLSIYERNETSPALCNVITSSRKFARNEVNATTSSAASSAERIAALTFARAIAWAAENPAAWAVEKSWQFQSLVERMSDPEPDDWPLLALPVKQAVA